MDWARPLDRLRVIGAVEGVSFLLLLFVAMPLKYLAGQPEMVTVVGSAHGVLWIVYLLALVQAGWAHRWPWMRYFAGFIASGLPFGPWVFDARLRAEATA